MFWSLSDTFEALAAIDEFTDVVGSNCMFLLCCIRQIEDRTALVEICTTHQTGERKKKDACFLESTPSKPT